MQTGKIAAWISCAGLIWGMAAGASYAQEMSQADMEQMQRLMNPMVQADARLKPVLLISAHVGGCLSAYVNDLNAAQVAILKKFDELVDGAGRVEASKLIDEAAANSRSDVAAFVMGYSLGVRIGARSTVPTLADCISTIEEVEAE